MALIIATGSNLGDRLENLANARMALEKNWKLIAASRIYASAAVDYLGQPDFANQVLQFALPWENPVDVIQKILELELSQGRTRKIHRGPRSIDIDIIFWGLDVIRTPSLITPHERWRDRSFVVRPLSELPFFHAIEKCFTIPKAFTTEAFPL
jgi:2-amino-4-hydroxy-6-hydroxymethyldihydropteridine diphosphokinase